MWLNRIFPPADDPGAARAGGTIARGDLRIGCSGWQYRHWRGDFYPASLRTRDWFARYAGTFDTVEINNSFYRLPEPAVFMRWRAAAPRGFLYAVKASRYLTHMKKLNDPDAPLARFFDRARRLGPTLGPVLYQLPPNFPANVDRLAAFLAALPVEHRHAIEFRDPGWYSDRVFELLRRHGVALCLHDMPGSATPRSRVGPFIYVRFHGIAKYSGRYDDARLDDWAAWLAAQAQTGVDAFAYFNNDVGGHAPRDAVRLRDRVDARIAGARSRSPRR
jgi:uncharacterized protein YecE (DUF72 family)